jgi:large subunit ribosomal protein L24
MAMKIKKGDTVRVNTGSHKGKTAEVIAVLPAQSKVLLKGIGERKRHVSANQMNPRGSKKDIHLPLPISNVALVIDKAGQKTSRVGWLTKPNGEKIRVARQLANKEIK